ncbi:MAG: diguanylate cyclase [Polaromonas sp.]
MMDKLAIGLWGCFFGVVVVILTGSALAYARALRRIALNAAISALVSALYVAAFLGMLPMGGTQTRIVALALVAMAVSAVLTYLLFAVLGLTKSKRIRQRIIAGLCSLFAVALIWGWQLAPQDFLILCTSVASLLGLVALAAAAKKAASGDRLAWAVVFAICCMLVALIGLSAIAHDSEQASWQLYAVSAVAATLYMVTMALVLWSRYAYLIELHKLMAYGPSYDPVTRMRSHAETGHMVGNVFKNFRAQPQPMGVVVLTIANLYSLEQLHGVPAVNHALFVTAARLRRIVPTQVEMGRLGTDGFVLVMQHCKESAILIDLARAVESRLRRSVSLSTTREASRIETDSTVWVADIGVGVLMVSNPEARGADAIAMGRRMSRTAISYASRIAWFDDSSGETVELPDNRLL